MTRVIYFVRHGETDWNAEGRLQGQRDIALNPFGRVQAAEVARKLPALVPDVGALPFLSSPLGRTRETMEIVRGGLGLDPEGYAIERQLIELSFGDWEGLTWKEVRQRFPDGAAARERDKWNFVPPKGESYAMLAARARPAVERLPERSVVVSHGGVARTLLRLLCDLSETRAPAVDIWQGRILVFRQGGHEWH